MAQMKPKEVLSRANEFLYCADFALQNDYFNACAICSYAALFWAARAALAHEGLTQESWEHGELRSKFREELINKRKLYPNNFSAWLSNAFDLRNSAQYSLATPRVKKVRRMVNHAKQFLQKTEEVLNK